MCRSYFIHVFPSSPFLTLLLLFFLAPAPSPASSTPRLIVTGYDFGATPLCFDATGTINVRNVGVTPVIVGVALTNSNVFTIVSPQLPVYLPINGEMQFTIRFTPNEVRHYLGTISIVAEDVGEPLAGTTEVEVMGQGIQMKYQVAIARNHIASPGQTVTVPVTIDQPLDPLQFDVLDVDLEYSPIVVDPMLSPEDLAAMVEGTLLDGWSVTITRHDPHPTLADRMQLGLRLTAPAGTFPAGEGVLLNFRFTVPDNASGTSDLPVQVSAPNRSCAIFNEGAGLITIAVAGVGRESDAVEMMKARVLPNPAITATVEILFTLADAGNVRLEIISATGETVARLLSGHMQPGLHRVRWETEGIAAGVYFCRVISAGRQHSEMVTIVR